MKYIIILSTLILSCCGSDEKPEPKKTGRSPGEVDYHRPYFKRPPKRPLPPTPVTTATPQQQQQQQQQQQVLYKCKCGKMITTCTENQILQGCYIVFGE